MADFDKSQITTKPQSWTDTDFTVRYKGVYAGVVKKTLEADYYICAVSMERDGEPILKQCGRSDSIEKGAEDVAYQFWLITETSGAA